MESAESDIWVVFEDLFVFEFSAVVEDVVDELEFAADGVVAGRGVAELGVQTRVLVVENVVVNVFMDLDPQRTTPGEELF